MTPDTPATRRDCVGLLCDALSVVAWVAFWVGCQRLAAFGASRLLPDDAPLSAQLVLGLLLLFLIVWMVGQIAALVARPIDPKQPSTVR